MKQKKQPPKKCDMSKCKNKGELWKFDLSYPNYFYACMTCIKKLVVNDFMKSIETRTRKIEK